MSPNPPSLTRRAMLAGALGAAAAAALPAAAARAGATRTIPATGAAIPAVGLGTWITFNVGADPVLRDRCTAVMAAFFEAGGGMIDSSPMYGSSQPVLGHGLERLGHPESLFSAEKVWTSSPGDGPAQIERSRRHWGVPRLDLVQVHNLVAWEGHLKTLRHMKEAGEIRHLGITTSHGRRHDALERIMRTEPVDFVQLTYNILDREAEDRLLPLARDRGLAVIVNRPFRQKALIRQFRGRPLPDWAAELGARSWAQFMLKFILSHPAVTVAIPATTRVEHLRENKAAALGPLPDAAARRRMAAWARDV
ncbi:MAG TPA: aldo/keto reductase [Thermohalobaculum sp.]|nr:aldo/keto reductase [Thermohalobaculum sp.]